MANPDWPLATQIAQEMGDDTPTNIRRVLAEMKRIREAGYSVVVAVACWREWKQQLNDAGLSTPRLASVLKDNRLPNFLQNFEDRMPPVYESAAHDEFVKTNSNVLRELKWIYRAGRIPVETLDSWGVKHG